MDLRKLSDKIDTLFKGSVKFVVSAGILYAGSLGLTYEYVDSFQRDINEHNPSFAPKIELRSFYNPMKFLKDNQSLIEEGEKLREENPHKGYFSGLEMTG